MSWPNTGKDGLPIIEDYYKSSGNDANRAHSPFGAVEGTSSADGKTVFYDKSTSAATKPQSSSSSRFYFNAIQNALERSGSIVQHLLAAKEPEYCDFANLTVFVGTYNVNGQFPTEKLTPWLSSNAVLAHAPDIYAVGFQELDLSQQTFLFDTTQRDHEWADRVKASLHPGAHYAELRRVRLVGMFLLIYVRKELLQFIDSKSVDAATVGTGLLNRMGNKGGVAIRFKIYDSTICFINSHLAAGNDELLRRNQDYREISKLQFFQYGISAGDTQLHSPIGIFDHDLIFWLGDLNYRLQHPDPSIVLDIFDIKKLCLDRAYDQMIKYDQLVQMKAQNLAFQEFKEGSLTFMPTYKYNPGTDLWDSSEKCRVPAWCDRILWTGDRIRAPLVYTSAPDLRVSDHKPVLAIFSVQAKRIDKDKFARVYEVALREADRSENKRLPAVLLDRVEFLFKDVNYLEPQVQTLTIKNIGEVPVQISFKPKPNDDGFCKPWLLITPSSHVIKVGQECVLDLQVLVDKEAAWALNTGADRLEDILILHLDKGNDYFITVSGNFLPTCFGRSLEALVALTHPVRDVPVAQLVDLGPDSNNSLLPPAVQLPVPKELWRLIDHLVKYGLDEPDLFGHAGLHTEFIAIRDALDTGSPDLLPGSIHSIVEALLRFLDSLQEAVIPARYADSCIRHCHDWLLCKRIINEMAPVCYKNVFGYLIKFLKEILKHSAQNGTNANALAMIFAPMILRLAEDKNTKSSSKTASLAARGRNQQRLQGAVTFLTQFITHETDSS